MTDLGVGRPARPHPNGEAAAENLRCGQDGGPDQNPEYVDVLIVGAGLSGIGAACHLRGERPGTSVAVWESRETSGGTWDLFRYPGIRSDSDMFTLGYDFRPWTSTQAIADGDAILAYLRDTAQAYGVDRQIRYGHRVVSARWSSDTALWTVNAVRGGSAATGPGDGQPVTITCSFLSVCAGYFRYDAGYTPHFAGIEDFAGPIVHPQSWPADLDLTGRRVVVIGSGATSVTLVPALAERAAHVTMLQRSPSYIAAVPSVDRLAQRLRGRWPAGVAYRIVRVKNALASTVFYQLSRRRPETVKAWLSTNARGRLPADFDLDTHLAPTYNPWDQRLCAAPDGDLFTAIAAGRAEIVTGQIERFTRTGIRLRSGRDLPADAVITATGLHLLPLGGIALSVDGRPVEASQTVAYQGMMLAGVPNLAFTVGYTNASWTLKSDLAARFVCRLLRRLDGGGYASVTPIAPRWRETDTLRPLIDLQAGYILRGIADLPRQGPRPPWRAQQNYFRDLIAMRWAPLGRGLRFDQTSPVATHPAAKPDHQVAA